MRISIDDFINEYDSIDSLRDLILDDWSEDYETVDYLLDYPVSGEDRDCKIYESIHDWDDSWESLGDWLSRLDDTDHDEWYITKDEYYVEEWFIPDSYDINRYAEEIYDYGIEHGYIIDPDSEEDEEEEDEEDKKDEFESSDMDIQEMFLGNVQYIHIAVKEPEKPKDNEDIFPYEEDAFPLF